ncbi:tRNA (guanosine(37)-N1)-methyltransferase TrmD [Spiroplasma alleghenense]|uniref:tRNA (guanine-N(1)-)-methyltransferase n=1 Tax=Spiroplasma alleghenense TaxID=216931 RepID=A0A345Z378_9MOLU|nr:tRNA (guanosine(37)-N1)-methyltransferase TrmD [Spiroplasma alleghenense]AXK51057.1 tRNA (guanine-N(1)-)-methyltransferase [Spiroplasma alleghenense]
MKFSILTLFPNMISSYLGESIMKRALEKNQVEVEIIDIRNFATSPQKQVDDYQFGGGRGMVLMIEPLVKAIRSVETKDSLKILLTPQGKTWNQKIAREFNLSKEHIILIAGHYEGFDERILNYIDMEVSIGDFIITGGELAALVIIDSLIRITPGVIDDSSHEQESFENDLLDFPVYTKPLNFEGFQVPEVLTSGHHKNIQNFREEAALLKTIKQRPDIIVENNLSDYQKTIYKKIKMKGDK